FTGDAYVKQEKQMIDQDMNLESDFLQLGHHGSDTSTSQPFLDEVKPTYAIYSAGKGNTYVHPHQEVLDIMVDSNVKTYRTDVHVNIVVVTDSIDNEIHKDKDREVSAGKKESSEQDTASTSSNSTPEEKATPANDCIDINTASKEELQEIVHIGEERADEVIH